MLLSVFDILAELSPDQVIRARLVGMLAVLVTTVFSGHLASHRLGLPEYWAKRIMNFVVIFLNWPIALFTIWQLKLDPKLAWLPISGMFVICIVTGLSWFFFSLFRLDRGTFFTLVLAGGLSNLGYTGGGFVCYALFADPGLAMANLYFVVAIPVVYLLFFRLLKAHQLQMADEKCTFRMRHFLDLRLLVCPAVVVALLLNWADIETPKFVGDFHIVAILVYTAASLAFFAIGLRVNPSRIRNFMNLYLPLALIKFVITPVVAIAFIAMLNLAGQKLPPLAPSAIIILSASPSAVMMVSLSNIFDLNAKLASALWVVTMGIFVVIVVPVLSLIFALKG